MGNSTEICTDGELKFGFVRETYYPLHTTCLENYGNKQNQQLVPFGKLCKRPGVIAEILDQLGSTFNCRIKWLKFPVYGGLRANESGHFAGLLGALQVNNVMYVGTVTYSYTSTCGPLKMAGGGGLGVMQLLLHGSKMSPIPLICWGGGGGSNLKSQSHLSCSWSES